MTEVPEHLLARMSPTKADDERVLAGVRAMLRIAGRDPRDPDVADTPDRFLRAWREMATSDADPATILATRFNAEHSDEMIVVGPIPFASICEHHLLPFVGTVVFAYVPNGNIVGLSKIPRLVQHFASRPQVQERLTQEILDTFRSHVECVGAAVYVRADHLCAQLRGVRTPAPMTTCALSGVFRTEPEARAEFMSYVNGGR